MVWGWPTRIGFKQHDTQYSYESQHCDAVLQPLHQCEMNVKPWVSSPQRIWLPVCIDETNLTSCFWATSWEMYSWSEHTIKEAPECLLTRILFSSFWAARCARIDLHVAANISWNRIGQPVINIMSNRFNDYEPIPLFQKLTRCVSNVGMRTM